MVSEGRRSKARILVDILRLIIRKGGVVKPTHILYGANLSHKRMSKYLLDLEEHGFIERANAGGRMVYQITKKGREFVGEFKKIEAISDAFGIEV